MSLQGRTCSSPPHLPDALSGRCGGKTDFCKRSTANNIMLDILHIGRLDHILNALTRFCIAYSHFNKVFKTGVGKNIP
jgi:hypothetical protein